MIIVINQKHARGKKLKGATAYIGRAHAEFGYRQSPLANQWSHLNSSRAQHHVGNIEDAINCYHRWLLEEVKNELSSAFLELERLAKLAEQGDLYLICWCLGPGDDGTASHGKCHGFVVKRAIEWRIRERKKASQPPPTNTNPEASGNSGNAHSVPITLLVAAASQAQRPPGIRN